MTHGTPGQHDRSGDAASPGGTTRPAPDRLPPRHRLTAADAAAVDAVLGQGLDPGRSPSEGRESALVRLLETLDGLPDAAGPRVGDAALVDATLARIERFEDQRASGTIGMAPEPLTRDVAGVLPWHRNLAGAAAAIVLLASMALWTSGGHSSSPGPLASAGVLDLPNWDAAEARQFVETSGDRRAVEGALVGELWVLKTAGGLDRVVFVPDRERLAAREVLRRHGATFLGPCVMRPQSPPPSGD